MKFFVRTKNNDMHCAGTKYISFQNAMLVISLLMLILGFLPHLNPEDIFLDKLSFYAILTQTLDGSGEELLAFIVMGTFYLPLINIVLNLINRKIKSTENSYKIVMLQYIITIILGICLTIMALYVDQIAFDNILMDDSWNVTFISMIYRVFCFVILIIAFLGIMYTGSKNVNKTFETRDLVNDVFDWVKKITKKTSVNVKNKLETIEKASAEEVEKESKTVIQVEKTFCTNCGAENPKTARFCTNCGNEISN